MCNTITRNNHKLIFGLKQGPFLKMIEKNTNNAFKTLIRDHCKPLSAILTILESNGGGVLNLYPLVLQGKLHMHPDRKIKYNTNCKRWCFNIFDKKMKLEQQRNCNNHVVFDCWHGDVVCMSNRGRGTVEYADGVRLIHGCPKALMDTVA